MSKSVTPTPKRRPRSTSTNRCSPAPCCNSPTAICCLVRHRVAADRRHRRCPPHRSQWWRRYRQRWCSPSSRSSCKLTTGPWCARATRCRRKRKRNKAKSVLRVRSEIYRYIDSDFDKLVAVYSIYFYVQVYRLPLYPQAGNVNHGLIINYSTKEKKQKSE